jgi:hypothetical protein
MPLVGERTEKRSCHGQVAARVRVTDHNCIMRWSLGRVLLDSHLLHTLYYELPLFTCLYVACLIPVTVRYSEPGASVLHPSHFPFPPPTARNGRKDKGGRGREGKEEERRDSEAVGKNPSPVHGIRHMRKPTKPPPQSPSEPS